MNGYLQRFPRFAELTPADLEILELLLAIEPCALGHVFFREGERADGTGAALYLIVDGVVGVNTSAPQGGFGVERKLGPGEIFGQVALMTDPVRTATCIAATAVTVARLDPPFFELLGKRSAGVHARFQLVLARQLASDLRAVQARLVRSLETGEDGDLRAWLW